MRASWFCVFRNISCWDLLSYVGLLIDMCLYNTPGYCRLVALIACTQEPPQLPVAGSYPWVFPPDDENMNHRSDKTIKWYLKIYRYYSEKNKTRKEFWNKNNNINLLICIHMYSYNACKKAAFVWWVPLQGVLPVTWTFAAFCFGRTCSR